MLEYTETQGLIRKNIKDIPLFLVQSETLSDYSLAQLIKLKSPYLDRGLNTTLPCITIYVSAPVTASSINIVSKVSLNGPIDSPPE